MHEERKTAAAENLQLSACLATLPGDDRAGEAFPWEEALLARLKQAHESLGREREEAPRLCAELLAQAPESRSGRIADDARFRTWGVCEELLRRSFLEPDPHRAAHLASLCLAATAGLEERHQRPLVNDLVAHAWAGLGTARLLAGDLAGAEVALHAAALRLEEGTGDLLVDAILLEFEAVVREARGELREAAGLLCQAEVRYQEIGENVRSVRAAERCRRVRRALHPD